MQAITTIAGANDADYGNSDGIDRYAELNKPSDLAVAADGSILVSDAYNNMIRKISFYNLPVDLPGGSRVKVVHNQDVVTFDAKPEIVNKRTMVPVSTIAATLSYTVSLLDSGKTIRLSQGNATLEL